MYYWIITVDSLMIARYRIGLRSSTGNQCVSLRSSRTCTNCQVPFCLALGTSSTLSAAGINALIINASFMICTLVIALALSPDTVGKRVSRVPRRACANGSLTIGSVVAGCARSVRSARVWIAEIFLGEWSAAYERIPRHVTWAAANRS